MNGPSENCQVAISNQIFACLADVSGGNHGTIMKKNKQSLIALILKLCILLRGSHPIAGLAAN